MHVKILPGNFKPADYLSRFTPDTKAPEIQSKLSDDVEHFIRFVTVKSDSKHIPIQTIIDKARNDVDSTVYKDSILSTKWGSTNLIKKYKCQHNFTFKDPLILFFFFLIIFYFLFH